MRWVILDTETTGMSPDDGHRIVEIGAVEVVNRALTGNDFHVYLNPDRDSDPEALRVHGLDTAFLSDKGRFKDHVDDFLAYIEGAELIIHNAPFDVRFLNAELKSIQRSPIEDHCTKITDSLRHAKSLHPGKRNSLDALCDRYGISNAHRTLHGALLDSQLLADVWLAMTRGQDSLAMGSFDETQRLSNQTHTQKHYDLPSISLDEATLKAHDAYMEAIAKSSKQPILWQNT